MSTRTIKDPTFNIYAKGGNVENKNKAIKKDDLIKLAKDEADLVYDFENEIIETLKQEHLKEAPEVDFLKWLNTKPRSYFLNLPIGLNKGGIVVSISEYMKQREKPKIKKLDLDSIAPGKAIEGLTEKEKEAVRNLLRLTFGGKD